MVGLYRTIRHSDTPLRLPGYLKAHCSSLLLSSFMFGALPNISFFSIHPITDIIYITGIVVYTRSHSSTLLHPRFHHSPIKSELQLRSCNVFMQYLCAIQTVLDFSTVRFIGHHFPRLCYDDESVTRKAFLVRVRAREHWASGESTCLYHISQTVRELCI